MKLIEIIVSPTGATRLETKGFAGATCKEASRFIEQAIGTSRTDRVTADFHQQTAVGEVNANQRMTR